MLYQLKPADLFAKPPANDTGIKDKERELRGMDARLKELEAALGDSKQPVPQLMAAISELTAKRDTTTQAIDRLRQHEATATAKPLEQFQDILKTLAQKPEAERHDLRLKLRGLVADIVERIELKPYRVGRQVEAITIFAKQELSARHLDD